MIGATAVLSRAAPAQAAPRRTAARAAGVVDRRLAAAIALCAIVGLALRIVGAQGGLWLDEAFSAVFAHEAGTPARVLFLVNHDNNHHLNTLWLLAIGWGAPPLAARALSIATGTLAIVAAGLFAGRRSPLAGALAAAAFALSPLLTTYGMEARGYAPMLLAVLVGLWLVDGWLADPTRPPPDRMLGLVAALGLLSHLTFVYALVVIGGWAAWELTHRANAGDGVSPRDRWRWAAGRWAALMGHAGIAAVAIGAFLWLAARLSPAGFAFGNFKPFFLADLFRGVGDMASFAIGYPWPASPPVTVAAVVAATLAALRLTPRLGRRRSLYAIGILALPVAMAAAHLGNAYIARYYLVSAVALLLLLAEAADAAVAAGGRARTVAIVTLGLVGAGAAAMDVGIATNRRGDPGTATAYMQAHAPAGATVLVDQARDMAILTVNAASAGYRNDVATDPCRHARFLFVDVERLPFPARPQRCGSHYRAVLAGYAHGLSGMHWQLYERL